MNVRRAAAAFAVSLFCAAPLPAQTANHAELVKKAAELRSQLLAVELKLLEPDASDLEAYKELVGKRDSGVIRLLPRPTTRSGGAAATTISGGGAYYSFERLTHEYGYGSDIELSRGEISVGFAGADYGWIASLDADSLDSVTLDDPRAAYLASLKPPTKLPDARIEQRRAREGIVVDGNNYINRVRVETGKVYLLRSIGYRESDVLVALKAHRLDTDGSVIFAWKLLKRFEVPMLER